MQQKRHQTVYDEVAVRREVVVVFDLLDDDDEFAVVDDEEFGFLFAGGVEEEEDELPKRDAKNPFGFVLLLLPLSLSVAC